VGDDRRLIFRTTFDVQISSSPSATDNKGYQIHCKSAQKFWRRAEWYDYMLSFHSLCANKQRKKLFLNQSIVTYSWFSIRDGTLLHSKSQYTTVKYSRKLFEHTYTSDPHGLGTLTPIEFFQQDLLWQSSNTHSHSCSIKLLNTRRDNPSSGYRSACTPQRHLGV
jgi:hypothetical protein